MNKIHKLGRTRSNPFGMPLLAILIFLGTCQSMWAQVATTYTFAFSTAGTYTPITGGVLVATTATINVDDNFFNATTPVVLPAIGFPFSFNGVPYTTCTLNANGWIGFGNVPTALVAAIYAPLSSTIVADGIISAFTRDLVQRNLAPLSEIRVETVGSAPNREYVIQFFNWGFYTATNNNLDTYNFQFRLQENGNKIVISYGNIVVTSPTVTTPLADGAGAPQVGLRGASNADFNTRTVAAAGTWASSGVGATNDAVASLSSTQVPPSGLTYTWTPAPCTAVPASSVVLAPSLPIASSQFLACSGRPFILSLSASNIGNSFQWERAPYTPGTLPPPTAYIPIPGANASTYTATQTANTAYRCVISCSAATPVPTPTIASPVLVGMSPTIDCYCVPTLPTVVPNVACITNVTLGGINNTTTCAPNVNHVAANTGVTNFPSNITTSLTQGSSPSITVTTTVATASIGVWVDFNGNGVYDATILPAVGAEYFPVVGGTATIVVPAGATVGLTKMRVRSRIGALASGSACLSFTTAASSGEIEDYYVTINPAGCNAVVVLPSASLLNLTKDVAIATILPSASGGAPSATYTYALTAGTLPVGVTFAGGIISGTPTTLENGSFTITATSTPGACQGSMVYNFNVNNACTAVVLSATPAAVITPPSTVGAYSFTISTPVTITFASTGGLATASGYTYAITAGALPSGLLLNTSTGIISGTPNTVTSAPGTFSVTSTSVAGNCSRTVVYTFTTACPVVVLSPVAGELIFKLNNPAPSILASGGANYTFTVTSTGTNIPPTGLNLEPTGAFTGTPTVLGQTGTFTVSVNTTTVASPTACTTVTAVYTYKVVCSDINVTPVVPYIVFTKGFAIEDIILSASEIGSSPLYRFAETGLPAGLALVTIPATTTPVAPAIYKISGTPTTSGKGTFVVTATNPNAVALTCAGTSSFEYTVIDNPTTSLDAVANSVKVSPNPSKGVFNIDFSGVALGKAVIRVYDAQGKQVYTSNVSNNQITISLENLSSGIYLMEVDSAKGRILKRLAKQ